MKKICIAVLVLMSLLSSCGIQSTKSSVDLATPGNAASAAHETIAESVIATTALALGFSIPELPMPSAATSTSIAGESVLPESTQVNTAAQSTLGTQSIAKSTTAAVIITATTKAAITAAAEKKTTTQYVYTNNKTTTTRVSTTQSAAAPIATTNTTRTSTSSTTISSTSTTTAAPITQATVNFSIDGSAAVPYGYNVFLPSQAISLSDGESVLDLLNRCGVSVQSSGNGRMAYVKAIGGLREKDCGGSSGWVYEVNGLRSPVSSGAYQPKDGDVIVWRYSLTP